MLKGNIFNSKNFNMILYLKNKPFDNKNHKKQSIQPNVES